MRLFEKNFTVMFHSVEISVEYSQSGPEISFETHGKILEYFAEVVLPKNLHGLDTHIDFAENSQELRDFKQHLIAFEVG